MNYPETMVAESVVTKFFFFLNRFISFWVMTILPYTSMECFCQHNQKMNMMKLHTLKVWNALTA